nr:glycosyltransferase [Synechocystis sp. PCC 7509]
MMTKPLRIALIMQGGSDWIGGTEYIKNLILALGSLPIAVRSSFELCLVSSKSVDPSLHQQLEPYINEIYYQEDIEPRIFLSRVKWKLIKTVFNQPSPQIDTFIKRAKIDFIYPYLTPNKGKKYYQSAAWIPDFQHKHLTHYFSETEIQRREQAHQYATRYSAIVVLSSKHAAKEFKDFFPEAAEKAKVLSFRTYSLPDWYEADPTEIQTKYKLPDRFFVISNQFWRHKNHLLVFEALNLLKKKSIYPIVVCTGKIYDYRQPEYSDTIKQSLQQLDIEQQVPLLGLIPKLDQVQLVRRSLGIIQPSLFEGWSTVVEDARVLGKPIVLSDFPVHLEQNPPNSMFFERHSPESLAIILADWWERLTPGPNLEQETTARKNNINDVRTFAEQFIAIARGSCNK